MNQIQVIYDLSNANGLELDEHEMALTELPSSYSAQPCYLKALNYIVSIIL